MKNRLGLIIHFVGIALLCLAPVLASSHREAPSITQSPAADNTDVYAFVSFEEGRQDTVTFIMNFWPLQEAAAGPNFYLFDPDINYWLHIDNDGDTLAEISYRFRFRTEFVNGGTFLLSTGPVTSLNDENFNIRQFYSVERIEPGQPPQRLGQNLPVPPPNVGFNSVPDYAPLASAAVRNLNDGSRAYAGPRDDPFYVDLGATFDLLQVTDPGRDTLAGLNVHSIALEVPIARLTADASLPTGADDPDAVIGTWSTTTRDNPLLIPFFTLYSSSMVPQAQLSRLGMPLVNEVVIPVAEKDQFNRSQPKNDGQFLNFVVEPELPALLNALFGLDVPATPRQDLVEVFLTGIQGLNQPPNVVPGEMLRLNTAIPPVELAEQNRMGVLAGDLAGFPNGRRLIDDVVDISLQVAAGILVDGTGEGLGDGVDTNDVPFSDQFPYLALPHSGNPEPEQ